MKTISLTRGFVALIDDADYEHVSKFKWRACSTGRRVYAVTSLPRAGGKQGALYLHRLLMPESICVDHINGDGLDNQRANLRAVTHQQNCAGFNRKRAGKTSAFRGVHWDAANNRWVAQITRHKVRHCIGSFTSEKDAHAAYLNAEATFCLTNHSL